MKATLTYLASFEDGSRASSDGCLEKIRVPILDINRKELSDPRRFAGFENGMHSPRSSR